MVFAVGAFTLGGTEDAHQWEKDDRVAFQSRMQGTKANGRSAFKACLRLVLSRKMQNQEHLEEGNQSVQGTAHATSIRR